LLRGQRRPAESDALVTRSRILFSGLGGGADDVLRARQYASWAAGARAFDEQRQAVRACCGDAACFATAICDAIQRALPADDDAVLAEIVNAERYAERILKSRWCDVVKIAESLLRRKAARLTGKQVARLLGGRTPAPG